MRHEQAFLKALEGDASALTAMVKGTDFAKRFEIYQTSIIGTLQGTLSKTFKPLAALIGEATFQELCYRYAKANWSHDLNLSLYGADLAEWSQDAPFAKHLPYLADFIHFCYEWQQVYLKGGDPILLESDYPVYAIWQRCQPEFKGEAKIQNWQGPFQYVLYRQDGKVLVEELHINPRMRSK